MANGEGATNCANIFLPSTILATDQENGPDLSSYVEFVIFFSGGKDSVACALHLLERGIDPRKIEIHHHLVDGAEGSTLMDWPVTRSYCMKFAEAFGMRYVETWRQGGFEKEMLRENQPTAPVAIPDASGGIQWIGGKGPSNTRRLFPQVTADLTQRWCSSYLKVDVGARYLTNTKRFEDGQRRLVITGERAEESAARSRYEVFSVHSQDRRNGRRINRYLDHWRTVHGWPEGKVWDILERFGVEPHPSYRIGFSRCSCKGCIFLNADNVATLEFVAPRDFHDMATYESDFEKNIHREKSLTKRASEGTVMANAAAYGPIAMHSEFLTPIITSNWTLPAGAFKTNSARF